MATTRRKRRVELYKSIFLFTFFIYNIYFLWEKTSAWGHSNPATYVLKTEGDYRYGFGCKLHFPPTTTVAFSFLFNRIRVLLACGPSLRNLIGHSRFELERTPVRLTMRDTMPIYCLLETT